MIGPKSPGLPLFGSRLAEKSHQNQFADSEKIVIIAVSLSFLDTH